MAVLRFDSGVLAQLHDAFNVAHAGTGIEIDGSAGSIVGRAVMTQQPTGEVRLRNADGERVIPLQPHDLYVHALAAFNRAATPRGAIGRRCGWPEGAGRGIGRAGGCAYRPARAGAHRLTSIDSRFVQRNSLRRGMSAPRREQVMAAARAAKPSADSRSAPESASSACADSALCSASQVSRAA